MNVHKRCHKNVANSCGIDLKMLSTMMTEIGISTKSISDKKKKVNILNS